MKPLIERLMARRAIDPATQCWNFTGATSNGYGVIGLGRRSEGTKQTHRVAYELLVGPVPSGLHLDHICRNRRCFNPAHLEPVTQAINNLRSKRDNPRTHCKYGHEFTPENTEWTSRQRRCITCRRAYGRAYHARKKAA